jgi:hypothetical protein
MVKHTPLFASSKTAASLLDMTETQFLELVAVGALPSSKNIGPHKRWIVRNLEAILNGNAMHEEEYTV